MFRLTAMERTEELVQNLFVAQNELIAHLGNLRGMAYLAYVLFNSLEKNHSVEKNYTPEKNSSEMEKIRQTWMDDVVGLASEFYINEEAFNLDNLTELLKSTVGAITDILALGPEENSVYQTKKAPETCRERLQREHPDSVRTMYVGGCKGCPTDYGYIPEEKIKCLGDGAHEVHGEQRCTLCWDQKCSGTDSVDQTENWTCIDQLAKEHPENVNEKYHGGALGCPWFYRYNKNRPCDHIKRGSKSDIESNELDEECRQCWKQPYNP